MSTHNFRKYIDLLNEADLVPPNAEVALPSSGTFNNDQALAAALAQENHCARCGTPEDQHAGLKHQFVAEPAAPGGGGITRIKQLQQELKAAGAALGATGAGRDGIDGDLGPLTRAAAAKYPAIAAKYSDVLGSASATPAATQATISQLTTALDTIEQILTKYKVKMSESRSANNPGQMESWRNLMEAGPTAQQRQAYQDAIQRTIPTDTETPGFAQSKIQKGGYVPPAPANPYVTRPGGSREAQAWQAEKAAQAAATQPAKAMPYTQAAEKVVGKGLAKGVGKVASRAIPGVGLAIGVADAADRITKRDYTGAGIAGAAGLVSLIPGIGWVGGLGLDAINLARDAANDPKINISPEDATVLDQNLKAIQTLSKDPAIAAAITPDMRSRLERVIKGAASVIVADTPVASSQAATPTSTPTSAVAVPDDLVKSVDGIEKILTKYKFESISSDNNIDIMTESELRGFVLKNMHLLSESEQMSVRRDMMNEGPAAWIAKAAPKIKAGWDAAQAQAAAANTAAQKVAAAKAAAKAASPTGTTAGLAGYAAGKVWDGTKWATKKLVGTGLTTAGIIGGAYGIYTAIRALTADPKLSAADRAELEQYATVLEKYLKTPEDAAKLPPDIQQRLAAINTRMKNLVAAGVDR